MKKGIEKLIFFALVTIFLCWLSGKSVIFPLFLLISGYLLSQKGVIKADLLLYILHCLLSCYWLGSAEPGWQERTGWVLSSSFGWYLGLNYKYEKKLYSVIGKVITLVWLNYWCQFDILSPNFVVYIPIFVYNLSDKSEENLIKDDKVLITDSHFESGSPHFSLPFISMFSPVGDSPAICSIFYQNTTAVYSYLDEQYKVVSMIIGAKIYLQVNRIPS